MADVIHSERSESFISSVGSFDAAVPFEGEYRRNSSTAVRQPAAPSSSSQWRYTFDTKEKRMAAATFANAILV
jgi:hypothetical protein